MPKYAHLKVGGGIVQNVEYHKVLCRANFLNEAFGFLLLLFLF